MREITRVSYSAKVREKPVVKVTMTQEDREQIQIQYGHDLRSKRMFWREMWTQLFALQTVQELRQWEADLNLATCNCGSFYQEFRKQNAIGETIDFEWKYRLKSAVNEKLGKDNLSLEEAKVVVGDRTEFVHQRRSDIVAVTALSTNKHSLCRQLECVRSWQRFGLDVYVRNTAQEIESLYKVFDGVHWIKDEDTCDKYDFPTQKIRNLARTAIQLETPVLVVNSDCEIRGFSDWLEFDETRQFVGIRWNFEKDIPHVVTEFRWGLDAFSFTPRQAAMLPEDFFFAIGHPVWDYAVPALMKKNGIDVFIPHRPFIFHQNHSLNWNRREWDIGKQWMSDNLGVNIDWDSSEFRDSLEEPGWAYSQTRWVKSAEVIGA